MIIEEKAKAYDEALKRASNLYKHAKALYEYHQTSDKLKNELETMLKVRV